MKKSLIIVIIIILAIFLLYFISTLILNKKIIETVLSLKNSGYATTIAEIKPKSTVEGKRAAKLLTNAYEAMRIENKMERNIAAQESDVADSINYEENPALFKKLVTKNLKVINLLLEAAKYPTAAFDFKYEDGLAAKIPDPVGHLHNFSRLLRIYAKNLYGDGKTDEALNVLRLNAKLSFILSNNILLFHLIKALALDKTLNLIQKISYKGSVTTLESIASQIDKIDIRSSFTKATEAEMIMWQNAFSTSKKLQDNIFGIGMLLTPKQRFMLLISNFSPMKKYAQLRLLKFMKKEIGLTRLAYFETEKDWNTLEEIKKPGTFGDLDRMFIPNIKLIVIRTENLEAKRNITYLGLKTIIYKKRTGKIPKTLDEVVAKVPNDPFSGKKYIYKTLPDGFLLYSVGKDGKDDMGDSKMDIVWKGKI